MNLTKQFFKYVSQNIFGLLGTSCYILADTYFISQAAGTDGVTLLEAELFVLLSAEMGLALGLVLPNLHWTSEAAVIKMSGCTLLSMAANLVAVLVLTLAQTNLLTILPLPAVMAAALVLLAGADGLLGHWLKTRGARRLAELS